MKQTIQPGRIFTSPGAPSGDTPPVPPESAASLIELLRIEGDARGAANIQELAILIANETRKVTRARQIFVFEWQGQGAMTAQAATGLPIVDRTVPLIQCLERCVARLAQDAGLDQSRDFVLTTYCDEDDTTVKSYPMQQVLWCPIKYRSGSPVAGFLMTRNEPWNSNDLAISERLRLTYSQAWYWLATSRRSGRLLAVTPKKAIAIASLLMAVSFIPVSLTTLAPLTLAPSNPVIVTAALDGVIQDIPVLANEFVKAGQVLVRFNDTNLRNHLAVAEREVEASDARVKKTMLQAVSDSAGRHDLAIAKADLNVKIAERDYAREMLARATVLAEGPGVAIFGNKRDIVGKPVSVGEKLMEIANPGQAELHVDVPISDAIILVDGARVKAFLDSDPLSPLEAKVVRADYQAKPLEGGTLAFRVVAEFDHKQENLPRLGTRGTAQIFGSKVPLIYFFLRRPISFVRQWTGL